MRHRAAGKADDQNPPLERDAAQGGGEQIAADRIVNHIRAPSAGQFLDAFAHVLAVAINQVIRAMLPGDLQLVGAAGGGNHRCAQLLANGHSGQSHAAGRAMHHQRLAGPQPRPMPQGNVRGAEHHRKRRAVLPGHRRRHRHAAVDVDHHLLGVATVRGDGNDAIPGFATGHALAYLQHLAGHFKAGAERRLWLYLILAPGDQAVGEIDPASADPNPHLACGQHGRGNLFKR